MKMTDLINENDMMSFFKDLQKNNPKFKNLRVHGDPEHDELRRQDQEKRDAERQAAHHHAQDATAKDHANLLELEAEYAKMLAKYKSLGGNGWQYADREQNLTSQEREARSMEHGLQHLHARIAKAKKHGEQGVAEGGGAKQAAIAIAKKESGKYNKDGKRLKETATVGATSSANIGTVVSPHIAIGKKRGNKSYTGTPGHSGKHAPKPPKVVQPKNKDGTAKNGADLKGTSLFGGPALKR